MKALPLIERASIAYIWKRHSGPPRRSFHGCGPSVSPNLASSTFAARTLCYSSIMLPYLSARQAAQLLGRTPRMAARRAKEAADQGDPNVIRVGRTWIAPEAWWREHVKPKPIGRPRRSADPS